MSTSSSEIFDLRNFYFYKSGNVFTGSLGSFNYKIVPGNDDLTALTWHGLLCSELANIENQKTVPLTQEGFDELIKWLEDTYKNG